MGANTIGNEPEYRVLILKTDQDFMYELRNRNGGVWPSGTTGVIKLLTATITEWDAILDDGVLAWKEEAPGCNEIPDGTRFRVVVTIPDPSSGPGWDYVPYEGIVTNRA